MTDDDMHILAGAYALNALSPEELEPFVDHLSECDTCAVEVREWQATLAELGQSVAVAPPPELRTLVLAGASRLPQLPPLTGLSLPTAPPTTPLGPDDRAPDDLQPRRLERAAPRHAARRSRRRSLLAAAAVVLVIGGTAAGVAIWQNQHQTGQVTVEEQISAVVSAPDAQVLSGTVKGGGEITVLASAQQGEGVLLGPALPQIPTDRDYQVWAIKDDVPRSLGLFPRAPATPRLLLPGIANSDAIAISKEPDGGSPQPTHVLAVVPLK
ncbi:MAG: anti-sigma factor [Nocardioidaceae bacterium]